MNKVFPYIYNVHLRYHDYSKNNKLNRKLYHINNAPSFIDRINGAFYVISQVAYGLQKLDGKLEPETSRKRDDKFMERLNKITNDHYAVLERLDD